MLQSQQEPPDFDKRQEMYSMQHRELKHTYKRNIRLWLITLPENKFNIHIL